MIKRKMECRFTTNTNYYDCINILTENIKSNWLEGDFIGNVNTECFTIRFSDFSRLGVGYSPFGLRGNLMPVFRGKLIPVEEGTLIEGNFNNSGGYTIFLNLIRIVFLLGTILLFIGFIANLFSNPHDPDYQNPIIILVMCIMFLIVGQGVPIIIKGLMDEDREKILDFIKTKLKVIEEGD